MIQDAFWGILIPFLGTSLGADVYKRQVPPCASATHRSAGIVREVQMENYKNSKIGRETAQKYEDILETVSYTHLVDKTRCNLAPCAFVNLLHGRA